MIKRIFIVVVVIAGIGMWAWFRSPNFTNSSSESSEGLDLEKPIPIDWKTLRELDWRTGSRTNQLAELSGKIVRLPGFVVPLEDEQQLVQEFLFVPTLQACIHVPPPPPNQMIYVVMNEGFKLDWGYRAFWLEGLLQIAEKESPYGQVSYQMEGTKIELYKKGN